MQAYLSYTAFIDIIIWYYHHADVFIDGVELTFHKRTDERASIMFWLFF